MARRQLTKWLRYLTITVATLFLILATSISVCLFILSRGPVDLQFLKPYLSTQSYGDHPQDGLNFDTLVLRWGGLGAPILIEGKNITVGSKKAPIRYVHVPHLVLKFHVCSLLMRQWTPRDIYLNSPRLDYDLFKATSGSFDEPSYSLSEYLSDLPALVSKLLSFKRLVIEDAKINIFATQGSEPLPVSGYVHLVRKKGTFHGEISAKSSETSSLKGSVRVDPESGKTFLVIDAVNLQPSFLFALAPSLESHNVSFKQMSCHLKCLHTVRRGFEAGKGSLTLDGLRIPQNDFFDQDLDFSNLRLKASFADKTIALNDLEISYKGTTLKSHGLGRYENNALSFDFHTSLLRLPLNGLSHIWPKKSAEEARNWITANIRDGEIPKANVLFKGNYDLKNGSLSIHQVDGQIDLQNARLTYLDSMPKIEKLNALATFNKEGFDIKINSGVCNRLTIRGGSIVITKFSDPLTYLTLNLDTQGSFSDVLTLIDYKPLKYASQFNLAPTKSSGNALVQLTMQFPLEKNFDAHKIVTHVKAKVTDAKMKEVLGLPIELQDGKCEVSVSDEKLNVTGKGLLNGSPSDFVVEKFFPSANSQIKETCFVKMNLNPTSLTPFGVSLSDIVHGPLSTEIQFKNTVSDLGTLDIKADLTNTLIKALGVVKPLRKKGALSIQGKLKNYTMTEIPNFEIKAAPDIHIKGSAIFAKGIKNPKSLKLNPIKIGGSDLVATMTRSQQGDCEVSIKAKSLDLSQYIQNNSNQDLLNFDNEKPIYVTFQADRLLLGGKKDLVGNNMHLMLDRGIVRSLSFSGSMEHVQDNKERVEIAIEPVSDRMRRFTLKTDKAGSLFKCLGILENVRKGALRIVALHDDSAPKSSWEGKLTVEDFALLNAPFLSHFVSLAFPTGLADLTKGEGLSINYCKAKFKAHPDKILISSGRANGYSLGFSFSGNIERGPKGRVNIGGSIIPAYFLNTLISKIPLIGELVSGGKHEGLFGVSFNITGLRNDPQISVNPLSALTPGLFRKLFSPFEGNDTTTEDASDAVSDDDEDLQPEQTEDR